MIPNPQSLRGDGQRRVHRCGCRQEARIHNIEIVVVPGLALRVQRGPGRIIAHNDRAALM